MGCFPSHSGHRMQSKVGIAFAGLVGLDWPWKGRHSPCGSSSTGGAAVGVLPVGPCLSAQLIVIPQILLGGSAVREKF